MVNTNLLKSKFALNGLTQAQVAEKIGMNPSTLSQKISNESNAVFSIDEVNKLADLLSIKKNELVKIFLPKNLRIRKNEELRCQG